MIGRDEQGMQHAYDDEKSVHNFNLKTWKTLETKKYVVVVVVVVVVFLALQPVVVVFSQPGSGL